MSLINASHKKELREAGWHSRGYLPHFDGRAIPQFITLHLADSIPRNIIERWQRELSQLKEEQEQIILRKRIEKYLDQGYGSCFMKDRRIANIVQDSLLKFDGVRYSLFSWVVMPNHSHSLLTRFNDWELKQLIHSHKSVHGARGKQGFEAQRSILDGGILRSVYSKCRALPGRSLIH